MLIRAAEVATLLLCPFNVLAAQGRVEMRRVPSRALGIEKAIAVYLPASYGRSSLRFPVAYYLHGGGGNERTWIDRLALDSIADSLQRAGVPEAILVMPDGDTGYWINWEEPEGFRARCMADPRRALLQEPSATYCVPHGQYESYVVQDVVRFVDSAYRTRPEQRHRGIAGFSMGGYGALFLAARHPDLFSAAVSHSGVASPLYVGPHPYAGRARFAGTVSEILDQWPSYRWSLFLLEFGRDTSGWWARDPFRQIDRLLAAGRPVPDLSLDVGTMDRFADQNRALSDTLRKRGVAHRYREWPGGHDDAYWRAHAGGGLAWLLECIAR
jgi:S-formylglutathione hydrolase FrmB